MARQHPDQPTHATVTRLPLALPEPSDMAVGTWLPRAESVPKARRLVTTALAGWHMDELTHPASLVASELATNAVRHARSPFRLTVQELPGAVLLRVVDHSVELPRRLPQQETSEGGRGLALLDSLCLQWGVIVLGDRGKSVWALLDGSGLVSASRAGPAPDDVIYA